jgi:hypothetical protein
LGKRKQLDQKHLGKKVGKVKNEKKKHIRGKKGNLSNWGLNSRLAPFTILLQATHLLTLMLY